MTPKEREQLQSGDRVKWRGWRGDAYAYGTLIRQNEGVTGRHMLVHQDGGTDILVHELVIERAPKLYRMDDGTLVTIPED